MLFVFRISFYFVFGGKQAELEFQLCSNNNNNIITKITAMHMKYKYSDAAAVVDAGVAKSARNKHEFLFFYFCTRRFIALAAQLLRETERE